MNEARESIDIWEDENAHVDALALASYKCLMETAPIAEESILDAEEGHLIRTTEGIKVYLDGKWVPYNGFERMFI